MRARARVCGCVWMCVFARTRVCVGGCSVEKSELTSESFHEALRNVLIVMSSHEIFDPKGSLWSKTWAIIDR